MDFSTLSTGWIFYEQHTYEARESFILYVRFFEKYNESILLSTIENTICLRDYSNKLQVFKEIGFWNDIFSLESNVLREILKEF